jgi:hypothetical protein
MHAENREAFIGGQSFSPLAYLTRAQQSTLRGKRLDAVFTTDRHAQAHRHALHLNSPSVPLTQVYDHREIQYCEKCENDCVCIHVSI